MLCNDVELYDLFSDALLDKLTTIMEINIMVTIALIGELSNIFGFVPFDGRKYCRLRRRDHTHNNGDRHLVVDTGTSYVTSGSNSGMGVTEVPFVKLSEELFWFYKNMLFLIPWVTFISHKHRHSLAAATPVKHNPGIQKVGPVFPFWKTSKMTGHRKWAQWPPPLVYVGDTEMNMTNNPCDDWEMIYKKLSHHQFHKNFINKSVDHWLKILLFWVLAWCAQLYNVAHTTLTHLTPGQNDRHSHRRHFQMHFLEWKCLNSD